MFLAFLLLLVSCGTTPPPVTTPDPQPAPVQPAIAESGKEPPPQTVISEPPKEEVFDPGSITEERFSATKADVQALIDDLNRIIRAKNYNGWLKYLSDSYLKEISSDEFLEERTEELYRRDQTVASNLGRDPKRVQKKILRTPKDYFDNVVVPSRSNDRLDDIDFISENRVKAYTMDNRGTRLVLYDLELINDKWMIIN